MGNSSSSNSNSSTPNNRSRSATTSSSTTAGAAPSFIHPRSNGANNPTVPHLRQTIDGGFLEPQSQIYASSCCEFSDKVVRKLIVDRKLAPFYLGINDFEPDWTVEELVLALIEAELQASSNVKEALRGAEANVVELESTQMATPASMKKSKEGQAAVVAALAHRDRLSELEKYRAKEGGGGLQWGSKEDQARLYEERAIECPICFLYYPPPLVNTRCCDQPICTECFVQIKRADPTATHLESEPAACPFCMESNFGVIYNKETGKPAMDGRGRAVSAPPESTLPNSIARIAKPRRKSFAHTEKEVVTTDQIHPDWEAKVEAIKATAARRANRRIVFRQVGDRLVPVGVTTGRSGDGSNVTMSTQSLPPGFAAHLAAAFDSSNSSGGGGRRSTRKRNQEMSQYLESLGVGGGQDLEELMVLEAMRLSMVEDEERRKNADAERAAGLLAETSAQGAQRSATSPGLLGLPNSAWTSALADAIDEPMSSSSRNLMDASPSSGQSIVLANVPTLQPIPRSTVPIPVPSSRTLLSTSIPNSALSSSTSSNSIPHLSPSRSRSASSSSIRALAASSLSTGTAVPSPSSSSTNRNAIPPPSTVSIGVIGASLVGVAPVHSSTGPPPQLPLDLSFAQGSDVKGKRTDGAKDMSEGGVSSEVSVGYQPLVDSDE